MYDEADTRLSRGISDSEARAYKGLARDVKGQGWGRVNSASSPSWSASTGATGLWTRIDTPTTRTWADA